MVHIFDDSGFDGRYRLLVGFWLRRMYVGFVGTVDIGIIYFSTRER